MFERFTSQSRYAIVAAQEEARSLDHNYIGSEHLLLGLLRDDESTSAQLLASAGITLEAARQDVQELIGRGERPPGAHIPFTPPAKKCLELSLREALLLGDRYIGSGHLLLGLISQDDSVAVKVLGRLGADPSRLRARVIRELKVHPEEQDDPAYIPPSASRLKPVTLRSQGAIGARLDRIEERLTAIERHLGIAGENVVPPS
ncbi:MAG: Clp protease N-terminal domain-containing protein [Streptosporangiaceae bacterium]|jgi:ATP-dependent Clp protease ATP-binding subunit ClpC